jgi:DNA-binding SARP family transcriptional activator
VEFRLLGPLELIRGGESVDLGGHKQRCLLALLLLRANEVVSSDRLVEALWGEQPTKSSRKALHVYVSHLRRLLGEGRLVTKAPGYSLRVDPGELDVQRAQRLRESGEYADALALWRGPALAEFEYEVFAQSEIARLEELRLACLEDRIDGELAAGQQGVVAELVQLVDEHPLRQRLRGQLMLALYRAGREPEALERFQQARQALMNELGIDPSPELQRLQRAILNHDPELDLRRDPPSEAGSSSFVDAADVPAVGPLDHTVRKTITVMSVALDIGSGTEAGLDPEALRPLVGKALDEIAHAIAAHGGSIETVATDGLTAVFGLPNVHEDDALRALRAAVEARDRLISLESKLLTDREIELQVRIGIGTGEALTGASAGLQLRATGEPLTASAMLAREAAPGAILFEQRTRQLLSDVVDAAPAENGWLLLRLRDAAPRRAERLVSPMVGREREQRRLSDAFEQAVGARSCQLFTVLGLAGVGKSRLVREFLDVIGESALIARGRCLPYGEGITYWPLLECVKEAVGLEGTESAEAAIERLARELNGTHGATLVAQQVAEMIGLVDASGRAEEGFAAICSLFESLAGSRPVVLCFDDIHWAETRFLDLIEYLAGWLRDAPILIVCMGRPELLETRPSWGGGNLNSTVTRLEPLSDDQCEELLRNLVGPTELPGEIAARIVGAAEGNPLFVEEMLSMLIDEGLLAREDDRWAPSGDIAGTIVPPSISALLAARLDQLDAAQRAAIQRAAVAGKVFQESAIAELSPEGARAGILDTLTALLRKDLIRPDQTSLGSRTYRFRHLLIRDAAYGSIPKESRAELHERFSRWLEESGDGMGIEHDEIVGYHLEQAFRYRSELGVLDDHTRAVGLEAAQRLGAAGRRAFVRSDAPAGVNLISRAVALLPREAPLRVELLPTVRVIQGMEGDLSWADRILTEAVEAAATSGDRKLASTALVQRGFLRLFTDADTTPDELIDVARRATDVFQEFGDELGLARAWRLIAQAHYLARHGAASADASEVGLRHAMRAGDRYELGGLVEWLAVALFLGPMPAPEAVTRCRRLLREIAGDLELEVHVLGVCACLLAMQCELEEATVFIERGKQLIGKLGESIWLFSWHCAFIGILQGDAVSAEREMQPAYTALKKMGETSHFSTIVLGLAATAYLQGRYDDAVQYTIEGEHAARPNDVASQIMWRSIRAKTIARQGDHATAQELSRTAIAYASQSDFHFSHADALLNHAEVLDLAGDTAAAQAATREAIHYYKLKGNTFAAARAHETITSSGR